VSVEFASFQDERVVVPDDSVALVEWNACHRKNPCEPARAERAAAERLGRRGLLRRTESF
jgi:hypothetical protein